MNSLIISPIVIFVLLCGSGCAQVAKRVQVVDFDTQARLSDVTVRQVTVLRRNLLFPFFSDDKIITVETNDGQLEVQPSWREVYWKVEADDYYDTWFMLKRTGLTAYVPKPAQPGHWGDMFHSFGDTGTFFIEAKSDGTVRLPLFSTRTPKGNRRIWTTTSKGVSPAQIGD